MICLKELRAALKAAFPHTLPIFTGFILLGMGYGILMKDKGYGAFWSILASFIIFAGSAQYLAITFLTFSFNPIYAFFMTLMINARHLFYGISMLHKYKDTGKFKPYLIFGLCDETFSIVCSTDAPEGVNQNLFFFFITLLNQSYWILGTLLGTIIGSVLSFNTKGLDFVLTALFVTIFVGQWKAQTNHIPAIAGVLCSVICLFIFGQDHFIIPSMMTIVALLSLFRKPIEEKGNTQTKEDEA